jgi:serine/threonine-protein kinase
MSPEQCQGEPVDARADLYALGVVLYHCVTGQTPFRAPAAMAVMWGHVHKPPQDAASASPLTLTPAFAGTVMRALAKEPGQRFRDAAQMRAALVGMEGAPQPGTPTTPVLPLPKTAHGPASGTQTLSVGAEPLRRRRGWPVALAGLALAGGIGGL